jgi:hypothetical protein
MKKLTPEQRARIERTLEEGRLARRNMQEILDRVAARREAELAWRAARRRRFRRLLFWSREATG